MCSADHNNILHMSRQRNCRDVRKISIWSVKYIINQSTPNFGRISIEISLVDGRQFLSAAVG